jgi:hypothetical protein
VNDARHGPARSGAKVGPFNQQGVDALKRQFAQKADPVYAAARNQDGDVSVLSN